MAYGQPAPQEVFLWEMAERFGWTLEYIEGLSMARWHEYLQVRDGESKAMAELRGRKHG